MKDDFSFPVVHIFTVLVPVFSTVRFTGISSEWNLVHVDDVLWPDLLFIDIFFSSMYRKRPAFLGNLLAVAARQ